MLKSFLTVAILFSVLAECFSGEKDKLSSFRKEVEVFSQDPTLKSANWGFALYDVKTGEKMKSVNLNTSLIPASNMKIVTTATALNILGKDYKYKTSLKYSGDIDKEGTLYGNIYIVGSGDPTFGSSLMDETESMNEIFDKWVDAVKEIGIKKVKGRVIVDETIFDDEIVPREWTWRNIGNYYAAGSCGLTINENKYTVFFKPDLTVGKSAEVLRTEPDISWMEFVNLVTTAERNTGDNVYILGAPYSNTRRLTGTVPAGVAEFGVRGSMPYPAYLCARKFHDVLLNNGISIAIDPSTVRYLNENKEFEFEETIEIINHYSPPISDIIRRTNTNSVNTYAENLLKTIGVFEQGKGCFNAGIEAIEEYWSNEGVDLHGFSMYDGSGLAQKNKITPGQLAKIYLMMANNSESEVFKESLAVAGKTGTLSHLFHNTPSQDNLIGKSGFLSNVIAYSGYTTTINGDLKVFVLIVNDYEGSSIAMRNKMVNLINQITLIN